MNPQERNSKPEEQQSVEERVTEEDGAQDRTPMEQHRGGPLPNQKR
ncbi:MAG TPA: hypothetical protein VFL13_05480 [Candidatus Baltobacteraceae bacterium]|nr:hypothetical protein [Candidatus Baltobacteraceae bacterium]